MMSNGRQYLSPRQWREIFEAQGCKCCVPGCESNGPFEAEHSTPNAFAPGKPDQIMCVRHHKIKTRQDKAKIAKAKRLNGTTSSQWSRRKNGKSKAWPSRSLSSNRAKTREQILGVPLPDTGDAYEDRKLAREMRDASITARKEETNG